MEIEHKSETLNKKLNISIKMNIMFSIMFIFNDFVNGEFDTRF